MEGGRTSRLLSAVQAATAEGRLSECERACEREIERGCVGVSLCGWVCVSLCVCVCVHCCPRYSQPVCMCV